MDVLTVCADTLCAATEREASKPQADNCKILVGPLRKNLHRVLGERPYARTMERAQTCTLDKHMRFTPTELCLLERHRKQCGSHTPESTVRLAPLASSNSENQQAQLL